MCMYMYTQCLLRQNQIHIISPIHFSLGGEIDTLNQTQFKNLMIS